MAPANCQVVTAYEECGMSAEEIAEDLGFEIEAVKMILLQHSQQFSDKALSKNPLTKELEVRDEQLFSQRDVKVACGTIKELCASSEVDSVRFKAAEFIINEAKGRNDLKALKENKFNIVMISETMRQARQGIAEAKARARKNRDMGEGEAGMLVAA